MQDSTKANVHTVNQSVEFTKLKIDQNFKIEQLSTGTEVNDDEIR